MGVGCEKLIGFKIIHEAHPCWNLFIVEEVHSIKLLWTYEGHDLRIRLQSPGLFSLLDNGNYMGPQVLIVAVESRPGHPYKSRPLLTVVQ